MFQKDGAQRWHQAREVFDWCQGTGFSRAFCAKNHYCLAGDAGLVLEPEVDVELESPEF